MTASQYTPLAKCVALVMSLAILHPNGALAQVNVGVSPGGFTGGAVPTPVLFPDGTCGAPGIAWNSDADGTGHGFYRINSSNMGYCQNGVEIFRFANGLLQVGAAASGGLYIGTTVGAPDVNFQREAAATWQLGSDVNGAAINQTIKGNDGITGTDIASGNFSSGPGRGTGAGQPGDAILQTATQLATGTTAQTLVTRFHGEGGTRSLTDTVATTVFNVTTGNDLSCGGTFFFTVEAADATNQQTTTGSVNFAAADNAAGDGGETCAAAVTGTNSTAATSGTLTVTADAADGGTDVCNIRLTATGSLTETVGPRVRYSVVFNPTSSSCAITPQ